MAKPTGESALTKVIFSIKNVSPVHQSSPLVQSSDYRLPRKRSYTEFDTDSIFQL